MELTVTTMMSLDGVTQSPGAPEEDPSGGFELGGELRDVAILFCDIRGFTALTERMSPAEVVELIAANHAPDKVAQRLLERDVFVCFEGSKMVGTIGLADNKLRSLFVEPGLQGKGVGARLVAHLETHARKAGVAQLELSSSITARGFCVVAALSR